MHLQTTAPAGSYERMAVAIDTDSSVYNVMDRILQPMGEKLDKDMAELRAEIAALKGGSHATPSSRRRKTRKSRK